MLKILFTVGLAVFAQPAWAEGLQVQCGPLSGTAFAPDQGWYDDQITNGETVFRVDTKTGDVDMRFKDYFQVWQSVTDAGGTMHVAFTQASPLGFMILARYPMGTLEATTITEMTETSATMIQSVSRMNGTMVLSRVMTAKCIVTAY